MMNGSIMEARQYFPRGLHQPEHGYRFSLDPLLLASFSRVRTGWHGIDLGTGCGVISFGLLLNSRDTSMVGIDSNPEAIEAAQANIELLGFGDQFTVQKADIADYRESEGKFDFAVTNPPFRETGRGKQSPSDGRQRSRFEEEATLKDFIRTAAILLKTRGRFSMVFLPERLQEVLTLFQSNKLAAKRLRFVHSRLDEAPKIMLLEAVKAAGPGLVVEPPLVLYEGVGKETRLTEAALDFCPFLRCNAKNKD